MSVQKRFLYHASALAIGGRITRPFSEIIESQGAAVLPVSGGHGSARIESFNYRDLITFRRATCTVSGSESERDGRRVYNSLASVTIEGLNVMDVVTADRIVGRLTSEHPADGDELPILPVGSTFVNLRIAGTLVEPKPHATLLECATFPEIERHQPGKVAPIGDHEGHAYQFKPAASPKRLVEGGAPQPLFEERVVLTSLFEPLRLREDAQTAGLQAGGGCRIRVPGFGTVVLGEYLITRRARQLCMLRLEMGSPLQGDLEAGSVGGNGTDYP
jgi:hypothetical protein